MKTFVVGDVHGCVNTFKALLDKYWNPETEMLIQLGDIINRGRHSIEAVDFAIELKRKYPDTVFFLRGNHEQGLLKHLKGDYSLKWLRGGGKVFLEELSKQVDKMPTIIHWIESLPLYIEHENAIYSHAGISKTAINPFNPDSPDSVVYNRQSVKKLKKMQVIGHIPCKEGIPHFLAQSNLWKIDTMAWTGKNLTGLKISNKGKVKQVCQMRTLSADIKAKPAAAKI
jgi:serine/threonine protein phosphatase 1